MSESKFSGWLQGRSALFVGGLVGIGILLIAGIWWITRPSYVALYKEATEASQADILATLSQWQLPYRINSQEGVIEVPAEHIGQARIHLAEAGIPTRSGVGYELFDKADYGMSEFSQKINYQRALEGELARSIMTISEVKFARVHLTLKKAGLYQAETEPPKASVIVRLRPNVVLNSKQVQGIQHLVSSAVDGMPQEQVVVLDEEGRALSAGDGVAALPERLQLSSTLERELQDKAAQLLQRSFGAHGAQVSVRVLMNFDRVKSVREQPVVAGSAPVLREKVLSSSAGGEEPEQARNQQTREVEYVVGKERAETEHAVGVVERVSVGIVLSVPQPDDVLVDMQRVLEAALGLSAARGDRLVIAYMPSGLAGTPAVVRAEPPVPAEVLAGTTSSPDVALPSYWPFVLAAGVLLALIAAWLLWPGRQPRSAVPAAERLTADEREQLLVDLRRWLQAEK